MNCEQWIIAIAAAGTMVATGVIAFYAVMSHQLARSNKRLTEELGRAAQDADKRHIQTLQHLAAATLAGKPPSPDGASPNIKEFYHCLQVIKEQAAKGTER